MSGVGVQRLAAEVSGAAAQQQAVAVLSIAGYYQPSAFLVL